MSIDLLEPRLDLLQQEYVLVQAWKKTASYIRYHNWFSDTLELDRTAVNLPRFLAQLSEQLQSPDQWANDALRIVPAPKSQQWRVSSTSGAWEPVRKGATKSRLRPLAHVSLRDQVVATAIMLCLADRVETLQGDPRRSIREADDRRHIVSYGNRLYCDKIDNVLRHRWGSAKLYRAYFQDYRTFLSRPDLVAQSIVPPTGKRVFVVHADLKQFYDRVRPDRLAASLSGIKKESDDASFFDLAERVFHWSWHHRDAQEVAIYARQARLDDFTRVALPQGLVAAGFFANVVLLAFDDRLKRAIGDEIVPGIQLDDASRYVDDLRIVVTADPPDKNDEEYVKGRVAEWLGSLLRQEAPGLELAEEKTKAAGFGGDRRPLVRQSMKINRIQSAVSGGFDAIGGEEILDAIQGLMRSQQALSNESAENAWSLAPLPDVGDETIARFGAVRFRTAFRSIRPLLDESPSEAIEGLTESGQAGRTRARRNQRELDEDARAFALGLIERWVTDPSNVRLLRIALDVWPDSAILTPVLDLLKPFTEKGGRRKASRRVAWYCLAEVLRAGATETGLVEDGECLPAGADLSSYREVLCGEAIRLIQLPAQTIPWYLRQQALLFLAAYDPAAAPIVRAGQSAETSHYREMVRYLRGEGDRLSSVEFATLAVLSRQAFSGKQRAVALALQGLTPARKREIAERDPSFARELIDAQAGTSLLDTDELPARIRDDLCLSTGTSDEAARQSLSDLVLGERSGDALRNELTLLRFSAAFLQKWPEVCDSVEVIAPGQVWVKSETQNGIADIQELEILASRASSAGSLYSPPRWCENTARWRFQLGFLLRFILSRSPDFTRSVRYAHWKETASAYRPAGSHWYQRLYGFFNGQQAFGDDWLPITDWMERFLSALLHWPGCRVHEDSAWVQQGIDDTVARIQWRIAELEKKFGSATNTLMLPMIARRPAPVDSTRSLRACVVQTAIPAAEDFSVEDLTLSERAIRRKHRSHLSAALAAVERMLDLRETHKGSDGRLDWMILPELAVHPRDVITHLIPFSRAHKTLILAGLTYEELFSGEPLVNSALWIIPEWSDASGLQMRTRRQGKRHLALSEQAFNSQTAHLQGFRPCQWLVGYPWSSDGNMPPLWLTASVCYDATDLRMAADLRKESDVFAIPALNRDVKTFDQMALALHYHMFQLVVVANNGQYGGSNAYWPTQDALSRQIFHLHGQPQASMAFLEIDNISDFISRHTPVSSSTPRSEGSVKPGWKYPPAGMSET